MSDNLLARGLARRRMGMRLQQASQLRMRAFLGQISGTPYAAAADADAPPLVVTHCLAETKVRHGIQIDTHVCIQQQEHDGDHQCACGRCWPKDAEADAMRFS